MGSNASGAGGMSFQRIDVALQSVLSNSRIEKYLTKMTAFVKFTESEKER